MASIPGGRGLELLAPLEWGHKAAARGTGLSAQADGFFVLKTQFPHLEIGVKGCPFKKCQQGWEEPGLPSLPCARHWLWPCPPPGMSSLGHFPPEAPRPPGPAMASGEGASR